MLAAGDDWTFLGGGANPPSVLMGDIKEGNIAIGKMAGMISRHQFFLDHSDVTASGFMCEATNKAGNGRPLLSTPTHYSWQKVFVLEACVIPCPDAYSQSLHWKKRHSQCVAKKIRMGERLILAPIALRAQERLLFCWVIINITCTLAGRPYITKNQGIYQAFCGLAWRWMKRSFCCEHASDYSSLQEFYSMSLRWPRRLS